MKLKRLLCILLLLPFLNSHAQDLKSGGILKPEQAIMDIRHYTVALDVDPEKQAIDGYAEIDLNTSEATSTLLFDLVHLYTVRHVWVNKKEQSFKQDGDRLYITLAKALPAGKVKVKIEYGGKPGIASRPPWDGGFTWAKDSTGNPWVAVTCQKEGATILFPCKDHPSDEPNEGADLIITVPAALYVAGPGLLQKVTAKGNKKTYHWRTQYTINNYSILFNIGKFTVASRTYTTVNGNKVPLQFYVLEEHKHRGPHHLDVLERSVRMQEKYFGEFPWVKEKIAVCETPHLGMEHQTLNAYGNKFRYTKVGGADFDWLMHHELGHEWWGNKVTGIDWADMWIQEGICSFGDALFTRDAEGEAAYIKRMQETARSTQNKTAVVQGKNLDTDIVYHNDIYGKGAFFMHTVRYVLGDDVFFPAIRKLATDPQYTYDRLVNTDDVEKFFSTTSGQNLKPLFDLYLRTTNKLEVSVRQTGTNTYLVKLLNIDMALPMDVRTGATTKRTNIDAKGVSITSEGWPEIDPNVYYLKRVIQE